MKSVSYTMTRWHKIAARINAAVAEAVEAANKKLTQVKCSTTTKAAYTEESIGVMRTAGLGELALADKLLTDLSKIKSVIGQKNVEIGVTQKLSEADVATRQMNLYKNFLSANDEKISFAAFQVAGSTDASKSIYGHDSNSHGIAVLSEKDLAEIKGKMDMYKKMASKLSDEVADLNRTKVVIEISDEAMAAASLD